MKSIREFFERIRSLAAFLTIPLSVVLLFGILAVVTYTFDNALSKDTVKDGQALEFLDKLFGDRDSTRSVLSTLAAALITVTSITFSLLVVAVQQGASSFSTQILDQFLKRRANQFYFGFFVGLSLFTLLTLATTHGLHYPLFGTALAILGTVVALCIILVLIYTTVQQMRSTNVIAAIATMTRRARKQDRNLLGSTRAEARAGLAHRFCCESDASGVVVRIDLAALEQALSDCSAADAELVLKATRGSYVARGQELLEVRSRAVVDSIARSAIKAAAVNSFALGGARQIDDDPRVGVHQLAIIGWNSASSARSNPEAPITICRTLADLVWEWTDEPIERADTSRIVYPDLLMGDCLEALDSIVVAAAEAKQHQTVAEAYDTYARLLPRLDKHNRKRVEQAVRLSLGALSQHVPTIRLNEALERLAKALDSIGSPIAQKVRGARCDAEASGEFSETAAAKP